MTDDMVGSGLVASLVDAVNVLASPLCHPEGGGILFDFRWAQRRENNRPHCKKPAAVEEHPTRHVEGM
jgi:hypothetical protein